MISGRRLVYDSVDNSCDQLQPIEADAYLLDSATFMNKRNAVNKTVTVLLNHTSRALQSIHLASGGLMGSRFDYAKEVILNAELLYSSVSIQNSARRISFLIGPDLFDDLEVPPGPENCKDGSGVKRFLFDCVIEYLDSKYGRFCDLGFKAWRKVQLDMNTEMLIEEVVEEIRRWTSFAGMLTNELIEWEMSHSLGKWTDFEIEEFETGVGIGWEILEDLVDETVMEFRDCRMVSF